MTRIAILYAAALAAIIAAADANRLPVFAQQLHHVPYLDKLAHFTLYGLLALFANLALVRSGRWTPMRAIRIGTIVVLIVATLEEYSNRFVAVRDWSWGDLAANYLGILCLGVAPLVPRLIAYRGDSVLEPAQPPAAPS
jgi:VanZ family protein